MSTNVNVLVRFSRGISANGHRATTAQGQHWGWTRRSRSPCCGYSLQTASGSPPSGVPGEAELQARLGRGLKPKVEPPQNPLWILWIFPACAFGLGLWQVYRKGVKESFISEKESQLRAPPITLPHNVDQSIFKDRRVEITGRFKYEDEIVLGPKSLDGQPGYQVITPFVLSDGSGTIMVNRGWVPISMKKAEARGALNHTNEVTVLGVIKGDNLKNSWTPTNQPEIGLWFSIDVESMAKVTGCKPVLVEIVYDPKDRPKLQLPVPKPLGVEVWNNHLQYSLIWFGLAGSTAYMIYLFKKGKIGFQDFEKIGKSGRRF